MKPTFGVTPPPARRFVTFKGATFVPERDGQRLAVQLGDVRRLMSDHEWHTLRAISEATGHPEASVRARHRARVSSAWTLAVPDGAMKYRTIVLDPPWQYDRATGLGSTRAAADNYSTMTNAAIATLPVGDLAGPDAHLYLWVTNPRLFAEDRDELGPIDMLRGWGFRYVTALTWHKLGAPGMGWWFRGDTEHVLFGVRGKAPIPPDRRLSNHFAASRTGHSAKPDRFYEIVERVSPEPRLEMFARRRRMGWDVWGNEAPDPSEARTQTHMDLVA